MCEEVTEAFMGNWSARSGPGKPSMWHWASKPSDMIWTRYAHHHIGPRPWTVPQRQGL